MTNVSFQVSVYRFGSKFFTDWSKYVCGKKENLTVNNWVPTFVGKRKLSLGWQRAINIKVNL